MSSRISVSETAYCKMVLHAIKYPHCAVRGVLLGKRTPLTKTEEPSGDTSDDGPLALSESEIEVVEVVPATHSPVLAPTVEAMFVHLDVFCRAEEGTDIVGLYFCNQQLSNNGLDELWARIAADKIRHPVLLQIENAKLSLNATSPCLKAFELESAAKWRPADYSVEHSDDAVLLASVAVQNKLHRSLADFENHLDELTSADFFNLELNAKLMAIT
uniref:MPN domain-containing protein n=1 Tax=Globodera rostochiensis TaxID=31243 RepID=A0A914I0A4_GLORO